MERVSLRGILSESERLHTEKGGMPITFNDLLEIYFCDNPAEYKEMWGKFIKEVEAIYGEDYMKRMDAHFTR